MHGVWYLLNDFDPKVQSPLHKSRRSYEETVFVVAVTLRTIAAVCNFKLSLCDLKVFLCMPCNQGWKKTSESSFCNSQSPILTFLCGSAEICWKVCSHFAGAILNVACEGLLVILDGARLRPSGSQNTSFGPQFVNKVRKVQSLGGWKLFGVIKKVQVDWQWSGTLCSFFFFFLLLFEGQRGRSSLAGSLPRFLEQPVLGAQN